MIRIVSIAAALLGLVGTANGQCEPVEAAKLVMGNPVSDDHFGYAVAIDGDTAIVTGGFHEASARTGEANVFVKDNGVWRLQSVIRHAPPPLAFGLFGTRAALSGETAAFSDLPSGVAVFVRRSGVWLHQTRLGPPIANYHDDFGYSLAIEGDTLVAGAPQEDSAGSATVFVREGESWRVEAKLLPSEHKYGINFGAAVAINGDTIAIGAPDSWGPGSVYIFTRENGIWKEQAHLSAQQSNPWNALGYAVAIKGDTVIAGDYDGDGNKKQTGSATVFVRSNGVWTETQRLIASGGKSGDEFGVSVAFEGDTAIIGASRADQDWVNCGAAYVFRRFEGQWTQQAKIVPSDVAVSDGFGWSVALSAGTAVAGAVRHDLGLLEDAGAAYVFELNCPPCAADCDSSGALDIDDFVCFQMKFAFGDPFADCNKDGVQDLDDFICYQTAFAAGCP